MLINLSNHPSERWSKEQVHAAQIYGEIVDLDFPLIDPCATLEAVKKQVHQYVQQCLELLSTAPGQSTAVHIMGEMTFVYQFVKQMTARGVTCLASTTRRMVEENQEGEKVSKFEFVQFRPYEKPLE